MTQKFVSMAISECVSGGRVTGVLGVRLYIVKLKWILFSWQQNGGVGICKCGSCVGNSDWGEWATSINQHLARPPAGGDCGENLPHQLVDPQGVLLQVHPLTCQDEGTGQGTVPGMGLLSLDSLFYCRKWNFYT